MLIGHFLLLAGKNIYISVFCFIPNSSLWTTITFNCIITNCNHQLHHLSNEFLIAYNIPMVNGSIWGFREPYFCRKLKFHGSFKMNRMQYYGLKTWKQVRNYLTFIILKTFLFTISNVSQFFIEQKFVNIFL